MSARQQASRSAVEPKATRSTPSRRWPRAPPRDASGRRSSISKAFDAIMWRQRRQLATRSKVALIAESPTLFSAAGSK